MLLGLQLCSLSFVSQICSMLAGSACSLARYLDSGLPELAQVYIQRLLRQTLKFGESKQLCLGYAARFAYGSKLVSKLLAADTLFACGACSLEQHTCHLKHTFGLAKAKADNLVKHRKNRQAGQ